MEDVEFDPVKNDENLRLRGLPLGAGILLFDGPYVEEQDERQDYGETRFVATGPIEAFGGRLFVVVYTWRGGVRRIISFRRANAREARKYRADIA